MINISEIYSRAHDYIKNQTELGHFSGSVLIARQGEIILNKGYGMANLEHEIPNTAQTKFRLGSTSKPFTAIAILQLQEQGLLSIHDSIDRFLPDYPNGDKFTLHHILTHTSGIPNFTQLPNYAEFKGVYSRPENTVNRFKDIPLEFTPGDQFKYSNSGYVLLAHIVEHISKEAFGDFLHKHIFSPLKMHNSGCDYHKTILKNRASGYEIDNQKIVNCEFIDMSIPTGGGGLYSTVEDLYLFDRGLYTNKIMNTASLHLMHTSYVHSSQYSASYGYGWFIADDKFGDTSKKRIGHGGGIYGFKSEFNRYVNDDVVIIVLSNLSITPKEKIAYDLAEIVVTETNHV